MADAQLDEAHRKHLYIAFDVTDIPGEQFVHSWQAWRRCQSDPADAALFGHGDDTGEWFVRVNLARDLFALCKHEISPWDTWRDGRDQDSDSIRQHDRMAALTEAATDLAPVEITGTGLQDHLSAPPWQR
jgi:hypothetical protein